MQIIEELTAQMFLDQLSHQEKAAVDRIFSKLSAATDISEVRGIRRLVTGFSGRALYSVPAGKDLRVIFYVDNNQVIVVDVVRRSQLHGLQFGRRLR
jgi:hypothetical protein